MKKRPVTDPTSWRFQANIHGTTDNEQILPTALRGSWNQCQHGNLFFLSWHRMYLYYFERIVRKASGDPTFALPYWNYSQTGQNQLPPAFRSPADESLNPLYHEQRHTTINGGNPLDPRILDLSPLFRIDDFPTFSAALEFGVHGQVHVAVGLDMSAFATAARDPIFWLHHANIDRIWEKWLRSSSSRRHPTNNPTWMTRRFKFYDENGQAKHMSGKDIVDTVRQLNYRYDELPLFRLAPLQTDRFNILKHGRNIVASTKKLRVHAQAKAFPLIANNKFKTTKQPLTISQSGRWTLSIESITFKKIPKVIHLVYIHSKVHTKSQPNRSFFVGGLTFFGLDHMGHHEAHHKKKPFSRTFDITGIIQSLIRMKRWDPSQLQVSIIPTTGIVSSLKHQSEALQKIPTTQTLQIQRISLQQN